MKLKLIKTPNFSFGPEYFLPMGLIQIYSFLKGKGYDITQLDLSKRNPWLNEKEFAGKGAAGKVKLSLAARLLRYLKEKNDKRFDKHISLLISKEELESVDVLLISVTKRSFCSSIAALLIARYFKSVSKQKMVIVGGESNQNFYIYERFATYIEKGIVDYYIWGPGEESLYMLLKRNEGANISLEDIPGLIYRDQNKKIKRNEARGTTVLTAPDLTGLPLEDYTWDQSAFFHNLSRKLPLSRILVVPFQMIAGCPYHCAFCASPLAVKRKISYMEPDRAVRALRKLSQEYNTNYFLFLHDTFNFSKEFVNSFCDEILKSNLRIFWSDCVSVKTITSPDILFKMREAGACRLYFGIETASPALQARVNKNLDCEQVSRVLKWSHEAGIWTAIEVIAGLPHEKEGDINSTVAFIKANAPYLDAVSIKKFYLRSFSYMELLPRDYGLTNLRECDKLPDLIKDNYEQFKYVFDEIDGLKWDDKRKQIDHSYKVLCKTIEDLQLESYMVCDELNVLFYLYTFLHDKNQIKILFKNYRKSFAGSRSSLAL